MNIMNFPLSAEILSKIRGTGSWLNEIETGRDFEFQQILERRRLAIKSDVVRSIMTNLMAGKIDGLAERDGMFYICILRDSGIRLYITRPAPLQDIERAWPAIHASNELCELLSQCHQIRHSETSCFANMVNPPTLAIYSPALAEKGFNVQFVSDSEEVRIINVNFLKEWKILYFDGSGDALVATERFRLGWFFHDSGRLISVAVSFFDIFDQELNMLNQGKRLSSYFSANMSGIGDLTWRSPPNTL